MTRDIARIIDANSNRAAEALRVMEEYARFVLNDPVGCEALKRYRHRLADCMKRLPYEALLGARSTPTDVGTRISTSSERQRADAGDVFIAAAKRLPEALRTIEEYTKTFDPQLAESIEALRYKAYDLEQRLRMRSQRSARLARVELYVIVTASLCAQDWLKTAAEALAGGADCLQLREKTLEDGELLARARQLSALCKQHEALFMVNDRPDIALLSDADGVHLGQTDMPLIDARQIIGPGRLVGLSTHTAEQFHAALAKEPDYIAVGPMFESSTKPQERIAGPELLKLALRETTTPIVPIGGISPNNLGILLAAGADRVCVCSAIISADKVEVAVRKFISLKRKE